MISDLDIQVCYFSKKLQVVRVESDCVLETLGSFNEVLFRFPDCAVCVPAEKTTELAFEKSSLGSFESFVFLI